MNLQSKKNLSKKICILDTNNFDTTLNKDIFYNAINTYVQAFIYEPCSYFNDVIVDEETKYLYNKPNRLHEHVQTFANNDTDIKIYKSQNILIECAGSGCGIHHFLSYEENFSCSFCLCTLCKYCCVIDSEKQYCLKCYLSEVTVISISFINQPTVKVKRDSLQKKN